MARAGDSFRTRSVLEVGGTKFLVHRLDALGASAARLPFSLKILLENLLRGEDGRRVTREHIEALLAWEPTRPSEREIPFMPARVLLQDFTGVPAVVDLAAMRDAMRTMGGDPARINPLQPADLVIDHSARRTRSGGTPRSSSSGTASATPSCAGASRHSETSASSRPIQASCTR